jgi:hypothetical protein
MGIKKHKGLKCYKFHKIKDLNVTKKKIKDQNVTINKIKDLSYNFA